MSPGQGKGFQLVRCSRSSLFGRWHQVHEKNSSELGVTGKVESLPYDSKKKFGAVQNGPEPGSQASQSPVYLAE